MNSKNFETINKNKHAKLKVNSDAGLGHLTYYTNTIILAEEVADVSADAPIIFLKDPATGTFKLSALLGFPGESNLFIDHDENWIGTYLPITLGLEPFGLFTDGLEDERIRLNTNSHYLSTQHGHALFEGDNESGYLKEMRSKLESVIDAAIQTDNFISALVNRGLLTELKLVLKDQNNNCEVIDDLYTINMEEILKLSNDDVINFHRLNYWGAIYGIQQSLKQIKKLLLLKNKNTEDVKYSISIHINSGNI